MIPLSFSPVGSEMTVKALGGKPELKRHLESLGFSNGTKVVVTSVISGNVIVKVNYRHPKGCQLPGFVENCFQHY